MGSAILYGLISLAICIAYFTAVDHFLMDSATASAVTPSAVNFWKSPG